MTIERIESIVRDAIMTVAGIDIIDENANLLDFDLGIFPANFIYIFDLISEKTGVQASKILEQATFSVMTVRNLAEEILKIQIK